MSAPDYRLIPVSDPATAAAWRDRVARAYVQIFRDEPYFEDFSELTAAATWDRLTRTPGNITILAARGEELAAFASAVPLAARPDVARQLTGLVPLRHTMYFAELGVVQAHRGHGLGGALIAERIRRMDRDQITHVVMRVSAGESRSKAMYEAMGFEDMGVYMDVESLRIDGTTKRDRRLFLSRVLSQVKV